MSIGTETIERPVCKCERCKYRWTPRKGYKVTRAGGRITKPPRICPKCKSPLWNVKRKRK